MKDKEFSELAQSWGAVISQSGVHPCSPGKGWFFKDRDAWVSWALLITEWHWTQESKCQQKHCHESESFTVCFRCCCSSAACEMCSQNEPLPRRMKCQAAWPVCTRGGGGGAARSQSIGGPTSTLDWTNEAHIGGKQDIWTFPESWEAKWHCCSGKQSKLNRASILQGNKPTWTERR